MRPTTTPTSARPTIQTDDISSYISYEDRVGSSSVSPISVPQAGNSPTVSAISGPQAGNSPTVSLISGPHAYSPTMSPVNNPQAGYFPTTSPISSPQVGYFSITSPISSPQAGYFPTMSPISSPRAGFFPTMSPISSPQTGYSPTMSPISGRQSGYSPTVSPSSSSPQAGHSPTMSRNYYDWSIDPDFTYDTLGRLERARTRSRRNMEYSNSESFNDSGAMGGSNNQHRGGAPRRPRRPQYENRRGNQPVQEQKHPLKRLRRWLWIFLVFLFCIIAWIVWTSACIGLINLAYCIWGTCKNCAARRTGGCHDLPLVCEGIERSLAWSKWGGRYLIRFAKWLLTSRERWEVIRERLLPIVTPPDPLYPNPGNNEYVQTIGRAVDNVMEDLNAFADRAVRASESMAFYAMDAMVDLAS